ncbi:GNAT family N-acetyltransferase [Arthrobacter sp. 2RAF6]|uniref:GNAT family N-acetyltransferase n=1 Tax=Arthrobacter sp. 2RAF6 TaxID=3233002 RepID=UPI003F935555
MSESISLSSLEIRRYRRDDANQTLAIFLDAVTVTASADYSPEQIAAWSRPEQRNAPEWDQGMHDRDSYVAIIDGEIAGFSDVSTEGYIHMMFVSPRHSRRGIATALLNSLETRAREAATDRLSATVSITARPFFERHGFEVVAEQHPVMAGVQMANFHMTKSLDAVE